MRGAGGTPGGAGTFLLGFVMVVAGGYLLLTRVTVTSDPWRVFGHSAFGLSLLPLLVGIAVLFFNGRSVAGWLLTVAGATIILAGILMNMSIWFRPTSLFDTLVILGLLAGGIGVIARAIRAQGEEAPEPTTPTA
jgi:predicted membrane channel-forming protein YqfA (hemolysin III family)